MNPLARATGAGESLARSGFALVAMPGLPGVRIFETAGAGITDPGGEHGHPVPGMCGKTARPGAER